MAAFLRAGLIFTLLFVTGVAVYVLYKAQHRLNALKVSNITYAEDIAPVIYNHCSNCHRPGEPSPFSLLTYKDVAKRSLTIKATVDKRIMPPWPADPNYTHFCDENFLSDDEIKLIDEWTDAGAPLGDSTKIPPVPDFPKGSLVGKPDLTLKIAPY